MNSPVRNNTVYGTLEAGNGLVALALLCAVFGLFWMGLSTYGWGSWIASPEDFKPLPHGSDLYHPGKLLALRIYEVVSVFGMAAMVFALLIKPWREGHGLTLYGKIFIGYFFAFFADVIVNYYEYAFAWNTHAFNMGVWSPWMPGQQLHHRYAESLLWAWPQYPYLLLGMALFIERGIAVLQARGLRLLPAVLVMVAAGSVFNVVWESIMVRWELYAYTRGFSWFTLFAGTQYQIPLNTCVSAGLMSVGTALLLRSAREGRPSFLDRGLVVLPIGLRPAASLLAVIGFCTITLILAWHLPWALISQVTDSNLDVMSLPSYLRYE